MKQARNITMIIQARMGSTRLPGKSILPLAGEPLVGRILERVRRCEEVSSIVLAIPDSKENSVLEKVADDWEIDVFRGSEDDVLDRYYATALNYDSEFIVRLPADNPVPEPSEIDAIIRHHIKENPFGFSSNLSVIDDNGYPDGIGAEIFSFELLARAHRENSLPSMREHVHLNFFDYSTGTSAKNLHVPIHTLQCPAEFRRPDLILDVNTREQYIYMHDLYEELYMRDNNFHITDIIAWHDRRAIEGR